MNIHIPHLELIEEIKAHCETAGQALSTFGEKAVGDPNFVADLARGRECRSKTVARVRHYIATGLTHAEIKAGVVTA